MREPVLVFIAAFFLDIALGDPRYFLHPVRLMGYLASFLENILYSSEKTPRFRGFLFWIFFQAILIGFLLLIFIIIQLISNQIVRYLFLVFILYSSFAVKDMARHIKILIEALKNNQIEKARNFLKNIVGRDTEKLNETEIIRAAIESLSESFVDGFFSAVFWFTAGALIGYYAETDSALCGILSVFFYRSVNTLDSMVGYKNARYEKFGWFSAKADDILNYFPARFVCFFLIVPALFLGGAISGLKTFFSDRKKSLSPNAAHPMAFFAGALKINLGGKAVYGQKTLEKPVIGSQFRDPDMKSLNLALKLFYISAFFSFFGFSTVLYTIILH